MTSGKKQKDPAMHASESRANATSPPPIKATKPKPNWRSSSIDLQEDNTEEPSTPARRLVPVFIDADRAGDLQELLRHLGGSVPQQPKPEFQDDAAINARNLEEVFCRLNQLEVNSRRSQPECQDTACRGIDGRNLTSSVPDVTPSASSHFATQINSVPRNTSAARTVTVNSPSTVTVPRNLLAARTPPIISPQVSPTKKKYYVVLVGKCAGIYFGHWDSVEPLVLGVPGARHKSFSTHELAKEFYLGAKTFGKVKIVRDPGDDEVYGPMSDAIQ